MKPTLKSLYSLLLFFLLFINCKSNANQSNADRPIAEKDTAHSTQIQTMIPQCVLEKIEKIKNGAVRNPPTVAKELVLNGKRYYLIPSGCCDQFDYIIDENCKTFCSQGYGKSGKFNNGCASLKGATKKVIWRDKRNY